MNLGLSFLKFCIMPWIFHYLFWLLPLCMGGMISIVETDEVISFGWNVSNPKFSNEKGAELIVPLSSNLVITCPYMVNEYYKIYWVPKEIYENCFIPTNVTLEAFLDCDTPYDGGYPKYFELSIVAFTGVPGQKDFVTGRNYYLATMSTGTEAGLGNTYKGACKEKNMKLNISVVDKPLPTTKAPTDGTKSQTTKKPPVRTTERTTTPTTERQTTTPSPPTTTRKATTKLKTTLRPPSTDIPDINSGDIIIDNTGNGNSAVIDANDSGKSLTFSWLIVLSIGLSVLHLVQVVR